MTVSPELKIFVGGIGVGTTEKDVKKYFSVFGAVADVDMPYHVVYKCPKVRLIINSHFEHHSVVCDAIAQLLVSKQHWILIFFWT